MPTIMISVLPDGIPVDTMEDDDEGKSCPLPAQDEELKLRLQQGVGIDDCPRPDQKAEHNGTFGAHEPGQIAKT